MKDALQVRQLTRSYKQLSNQLSNPIIKKFRIVPQWQQDINLKRTNPKPSQSECFMVKRKSQIQKNRWKTIIKSISTLEEQRDSHLDEFKRKASVQIIRNNQSRFLKYVGLDNSQSLPQIEDIFRKGEMFDRLAKRTQPYWKKFMPPK